MFEITAIYICSNINKIFERHFYFDVPSKIFLFYFYSKDKAFDHLFKLVCRQTNAEDYIFERQLRDILYKYKIPPEHVLKQVIFLSE